MIDRARILLNRPLDERDRPRLFAAAVALILTAMLVLSLIGRSPARPAGRGEHHAVSPGRIAPWASPAPSPAAGASSEPVSEEGHASAGHQASRREQRQIKRAARAFLAGYLPYTYGRASARRIRATTGRVRAALLRERPRVPRRERRRHARVLLVQLDTAGHRAARVVALVDDRARRYSVALALRRFAGGWRVTGIGS